MEPAIPTTAPYHERVGPDVLGPRFVEPRRVLAKAMAWRAKRSHLGAFQILPEHVLLSCLARLPREDHDAVADCSTGFRAIMRSERFIKARRAEVSEEALVLFMRDSSALALVSRRMWRRLAPMPAEMRINLAENLGVARSGTAVIGSELFMVGGMKADSTDADVSVYDAIDDEWFTMPLSTSDYPPGGRRDVFAVGCAGRLYVGGLRRSDRRVLIQGFDSDAQRWVDLPPMPHLPPQIGFRSDPYRLVAAAAGSEIFVLDRCDPVRFCVFSVETEAWRILDIPPQCATHIPHLIYDYTPSTPYPFPSLCVDGALVHVLDHNPSRNGDHYAYDTDISAWVAVTGPGLPRHTACGNRILAVVNRDGPDDYPEPNATPYSGCVGFYRRRADHGGHRLEGLSASDLPLCYNAVARVVSIEMP